MTQLRVGDRFPVHITSITEDNPHQHVDLAKELGTGKVVIFGVPGAFTPACSNSHLPSFLKDFDRVGSLGNCNRRSVCSSLTQPAQPGV